MVAALKARLPRRPRAWTVVLAAVSAVVVAVVTVAAAEGDWAFPGPGGMTPGGAAVRAGIAALAVTAVTAFRFRGRLAGWFHPLSLPLAVITVMSLGAPVWAYLTHDAAGLLYSPGYEPGASSSLAAALTGRACAALVLVLAGYVAGVLASLAVIRPAAGPAPELRARPVRRAGLALMTVGAVSQAAASVLGRGGAYGAGQLSYGLVSVLSAAAGAAAVAGLVAVMIAARGPSRRLRDVLRGREWIALAAYLAAVALSGERAGMIAPLVVLAWAYTTRVRAIPLRRVVVFAVAALAVAAVIAGYRSGRGLPDSPAAVMQGAAGDVSSVPWITQQTVTAVPFTEPYLHGSTYEAAAEGQVPGPLSRRLGVPQRTASAVFRRVIGFQDPDQGFGESYPAEAYLNFGLPGCLGAGVFLGVLMGWAWRRCRVPASRARDVLYLLLAAGLVYGFRSDALTQAKDVLYPLLAVWAVLAWCRVRPARRSG